MTSPAEEQVDFLVDGNRLEGAWAAPSMPSLVAVVLHPHPEFGGDMDNHVVLALARVLRDCGAAALRFNFRGTAGSEGHHGGGVGEINDARAAVAFARERVPGVPLVLAGYSFGAHVAMGAAAAGEPMDALILVSPPVAMAPPPRLPSGLAALAMGGDADPICPPDALAQLAEQGARVVTVADADHGWWGRVAELEAAVRAFLVTPA